jgi:hypothetical protein
MIRAQKCLQMSTLPLRRRCSTRCRFKGEVDHRGAMSDTSFTTKEVAHAMTATGQISGSCPVFFRLHDFSFLRGVEVGGSWATLLPLAVSVYTLNAEHFNQCTYVRCTQRVQPREEPVSQFVGLLW